MNKELSNILAQSLAETKVDKVNPNKEDVDRVLTIQRRDLPSLSEEELTQDIYVLSQYLVFLTVQCNARQIKAVNAKSTYELLLTRESIKKEGKTVKEKEAMALLENPELQALEKEYRNCEADSLLFEKIPDAINELINAFKKVLASKYPKNMKVGYGNSY